MLTPDAGRRPPALPAALALAAAAAAFAWAAWSMRGFTVDDAYITLRYARHVAAGLGPVWNPGSRDEGYTSPLWMLLLVPPHLLRLNALAAAKLMGVAATLLTALVLARWRPGGAARADALAAAALWLALPATAVHAVSGMETALAGLCVTLLFRAAGRAGQPDGAAAARALPVLALLAGAARPEAHALAAIVIGGVARRLGPPARRALLARCAWIWLAPAAAHEAWRLAYYGVPAPLPFFVKFGHPGALPGLEPVAAWAGAHALHLGVLLVPAFLPLAPGLGGPWLAALAMLGFYLFPQHLMGYHGRYLAPLSPLVCATAGAGLARARGWLAARAGAAAPRARAWALARALPAAAPLALVAWLAAGDPAAIADRNLYAACLARAHEPLGRELAALPLAGVRLALSDAGAIPYLSDAWTLDLGGLDDRRIALGRDRAPARVFARGVNALILVSARSARFAPFDWNAYEGPLYAAAVARGWRRVALRRFHAGYWLWVLAPRGSPLARLAGGP